ncbi:helix-turn-helix domain-containing protein [Enterococcus termitis]|uniref:Mga helix-turn-helix domain-containing protein n=1 Tax=Enterococcus termitis TaxID=332950 RepID=A0A1E5H4U4_9ENTE|nr:helix-turn-helix domain-containing protein [Enterococcus termitis]OEG19954.1 hypothetical protein BCR25_14270 [Enterococcus termitis]OJG97742.1 hypothetical protein RV18_GL000559 [Enterococcus termitis]
MERLLSPAMHRRVLLLNLLNEPNGWVTSEELAEKIKCSKKTVILDCQYIEDRWSDYFTLEVSRKYGIRLIASPYQSIHEIYIEIIKESNAFSFLESIFFSPNQSAAYWEEKFYLSNSSLYRLSNLILSALKERKIELSRSPYYVYGKDERKVRYFFTSYFIEVYGNRDWPFPFDKDKLFALADKIAAKFELELNDGQIVHLVNSIAVTIIRESQGFLIKKKRDPINNYVKKMIDIKKYQKEVEEILAPLEIVLPKNWYEDFCYSLFWWDFGWDNLQEKENVLTQANQLVDTIKEALTIEISDSSRESIVRLIEHVYAKHKMFPYKKYMVYDRFLYSSKIIRQTYLVLGAVVTKALRDLEKKMKFPWESMYLNELLHEISIRWDQLTEQSDAKRHQISVLVLSDLGKDHAKLLGSILADNFRDKIAITVQKYPYYDQPAQTIDNTFDLYVSNYALNHIDAGINMIVEDIPSFKNIMDLRGFIDKKRLVLPKDVPYLNV